MLCFIGGPSYHKLIIPTKHSINCRFLTVQSSDSETGSFHHCCCLCTYRIRSASRSGRDFACATVFPLLRHKGMYMLQCPPDNQGNHTIDLRAYADRDVGLNVFSCRADLLGTKVRA